MAEQGKCLLCDRIEELASTNGLDRDPVDERFFMIVCDDCSIEVKESDDIEEDDCERGERIHG